MNSKKENEKIVIKVCLAHGKAYAKTIKQNYILDGVTAEESRVTATVTLAAICAEILKPEELDTFKGQIIEIMDGRLQQYLGVANQ